MSDAPVSQEANWLDLLQALECAQQHFDRWHQEGILRQGQLELIADAIRGQQMRWEQARKEGQPVPGNTSLPPAREGESLAARGLRYWTFIEAQIRKNARSGFLMLTQAHRLLAEVQGRQAALVRRLNPGEVPDVIPVDEAPAPDRLPGKPARKDHDDELVEMEERRFQNAPRAAPGPRRSLLEILLDPRSIQILLAFGGALVVAGLVILLWVNELITPPVAALGLGVLNAALLGAGWWVLRSTRYQVAGRAVTLLACLVMPLNLWYYQSTGLLTIDGHLWVAAVGISALYAVSALVLRDEVFVYVLVAGITMTGLLILADLPPSPQRFWEIALPATLLVVLGLLAIHVERAFPDEEGPFSRRRFGLAFFWSGHAVLAAGLLLVLGAQVAGDWLYRPVFRAVYERLGASPSPVVGELRLLALALVLAGTYAYVYSDIVVRRVGVYMYVAAFTLLWAFVLVLQHLQLALGVDALIAVLAVAALVVNGLHAAVFRTLPATRSFPFLGLLLGLVAVGIGLITYFRAVSLDLRSVWGAEAPSWTYVAAMALTAACCRVGAHLYRHSHPGLSTTYFFATGAATLVGAASLLAALGLERWQEHAPWLMLLPIAYLIAARLYRGSSAERPLLWVAHTATAVMLVSSLASSVEGFARLVERQQLNLALAVFFAEGALFYALAAALHRQVAGVHLSAALACAAAWQLLTYAGVEAEYYTLALALVGAALLVGYRLAVLDRAAGPAVADAAFQVANTLLSLSFVATAFLALSRLATARVQGSFVVLCVVLTLVSLFAVLVVRQTGWRRWYVVTSIGLALLTCLALEAISTLTYLQRLEIFFVATGLLFLIAGHLGWYREQDRENDLVTLALFLGSWSVCVPLAVATLVDRSRSQLILANELGFLAASVLLLISGCLFRLKATALTGALFTALYFVTLLIFVPWGRINTVAIVILAGGGFLFLTGLLLSVYRERLLALPERIRNREGLFRILGWR